MQKPESFIQVIIILSALAAMLIAGCKNGGGTSPATLASIAVTPSNPSIVVGATQQFTATGTYSNGSKQDITTSVAWNSSNTAVATISNTGMAIAVSAGSATVTATSGSKSDFATLTATSSGVGIVDLPKTGQTTSYKTGDDGDLEMGVAWPNPRFTVGSGAEADCVTDNLTGLMWAKSPDSIPKVRYDALVYADSLSLGGHDNWRLPNRNELRSLINYGHPNNTLWLKGQGFSNVHSGLYWSSTAYAGNPGSGWRVDMIRGGISGFSNTTSYEYVWAVRGVSGGTVELPVTGQTTSYTTGDDGDLEMGVAWPTPRFAVGSGAEADCVTDNLTGLMWVKSPDDTQMNWQEALIYANDLSVCGHDDWRLPNLNELESMVHAGQANTSTWLGAQGFSNLQASDYWSSTVYANEPLLSAWAVNVSNGTVEATSQTNSLYVWLVRAGQ